MGKVMEDSNTIECDRNKSDLTHRVTSGVISWMDGAGFKPVETEVFACPGWIADVAGVISPTRTEATNLKLIPRRKPYQNNPTAYEDWNAAYNAIPCAVTGIVEVKVNRSDFRGDHKWTEACPADLCWLAMPSGAFDISELPATWGILEFTEGGVRTKRHATLNPIAIDRRLQLILSIAVRRDHSTRYERLRKFQRMATVEANERTNLTRVADVIRGVLSVVKGEYESPEMAMRFHGIRKIPPYMKKELEELWGCGKV